MNNTTLKKISEILGISISTVSHALKIILTSVQLKPYIYQLQIPVDISVVSISNGFIPNLYYPEITYAETSGYKLGKLAFQA